MKSKRDFRQKHGIALAIGAKTLNETHYGAFAAKFNSIERDVIDVEMMAKLGGMEVKVLVNEQATRLQVLTNIGKAAKSLKQEDIFLLYFSGYGGKIANFAGANNQPYCPTWCLFDAQITFNELIIFWKF